MLSTAIRLLPVIAGIAVGYSLRRLGMVDRRDAEAVFRLVFYIFIPAALFTSLSAVELDRELALFPLAAVALILAGYLAGRLLTARTTASPQRAAVVITACMIVNTAFAIPFAQAVYGQEGVARIGAFDIVNTTVTLTLAYYVAVRGNPRHHGTSLLLGRLAKSPALYATAAGLLVNLAGVDVPRAVAEPVALFGSAIGVLIPVGVGILFDPLGKGFARAAKIVAVRLGTGIVVAVAIVLGFGLDGADRTIMLLLGVTPVAPLVLTFATLENLDTDLAANVISLSLLTGVALSFAVTLLFA